MTWVTKRRFLAHTTRAPKVVLGTEQRFFDDMRTDSRNNRERVLARLLIMLQAPFKISRIVFLDRNSIVGKQIGVQERFDVLIANSGSLSGFGELTVHVLVAVAIEWTQLVFQVLREWHSFFNWFSMSFWLSWMVSVCFRSCLGVRRKVLLLFFVDRLFVFFRFLCEVVKDAVVECLKLEETLLV